MKRNYLFLLCFLLALGACGQKGKNISELPPKYNTEEPVLSEDPEGDSVNEANASPKAASLSDMLDDITGSVDTNDPATWYSHYNNRTIIYENSYTYRIFSDGIYRRAAGSKEWEALYSGEMSSNHALQLYNDFLYFTLDREGSDPEAILVPQTLWQLNLNTLESRKIGDMIENVPYITSIYDGNLYIGYTLYGALRYDVYPLNDQGMPEDKLSEDSPDFICAKQNAFSLEEESHWNHSDRSGSLYSSEMLEMKKEVIPIPFCAQILNGYYLTQGYYDESLTHFYLTKADTGEDQFLFDAYLVLAITPTGIYYRGEEVNGNDFYYYSFSQNASLTALHTEISSETFRLLTYDRAWLYFQVDNSIVRMSRSTGDVETFLETIPGNINLRYCAIDPEYLYVDETMYPL